MRRRSSILALAAFALSATSGVCDAQPTAQNETRTDAVRHVAQWNLGKADHLAIQGYDPVAYFPEGGSKPQRGLDNLTLEFKGALYRFASEANRELFKADPARYEPSYGGWCAWAMLDGEKVEVDPKSFIVEDGRLYLFYNGILANTRSKWRKKDHASQVAIADAKWKAISGEAPRQSTKQNSPVQAPPQATNPK